MNRADPAGAPAGTGALMVARVGARRIALPADAIARVLPMLPLWRPPTAPPPVAGFAMLAEGAVPVLSAAALLGQGGSGPPDLYAHILLLAGADAGGRATGLLVDRAEGLAHPAHLAALAPGDTLAGLATAAFAREGVPVHLIAPDGLLDRAAREALAALAREAERRRAEWAA